MKIAISAQSADFDALVEPRFGRCRDFIVVEPETLAFQALAYTELEARGGAGIQTAQWLAAQGVDVLLTGNCGPNAFTTLEAAGVQVCTGVNGTVREAVTQYQHGQFKAATHPNVSGHFGHP